MESQPGFIKLQKPDALLLLNLCIRRREEMKGSSAVSVEVNQQRAELCNAILTVGAGGNLCRRIAAGGNKESSPPDPWAEIRQRLGSDYRAGRISVSLSLVSLLLVSSASIRR
jgi:hypothetical protein